MENSRQTQNLAEELISMVRDKLSPIALKYGYSDTSLEQLIKWKPIVLLLGNFSSGKSSMINDLSGKEVQETGQAPTDDCFTLITHKAGIASSEVIEGTAVINDPGLPFQHLSKFGQRFVAHFKMKMVDVPLLKEFAIIDTPGMLDSVSEKDRGYNYQAVISDLAIISDLIIVFFDPHRPGTVRETHDLLRKTLPSASYENRTIFVLNRVDECENFEDLLRTYGTLCWNLSQMTGRKDIPKIFLSHRERPGASRDFLKMLVNQRSDVKNLICDAPRHRLEHMLSFSESHGRNLLYFLEIIENFGVERRKVLLKSGLVGMAAGLAIGSLFWSLSLFGQLWQVDPDSVSIPALVMGAVGGVVGLLWARHQFMNRFHANVRERAVGLAAADHQGQDENRGRVKDSVDRYLAEKKGRFSVFIARRDARKIRQFLNHVNQDARTVLSNA